MMWPRSGLLSRLHYYIFKRNVGIGGPPRATGATSRFHYCKNLRKVGPGSPSALFVAELARGVPKPEFGNERNNEDKINISQLDNGQYFGYIYGQYDLNKENFKR